MTDLPDAPAAEPGPVAVSDARPERLSVADFDSSRLPSWAQGAARRSQAFMVRHQDHVTVAMAQRFSAILGPELAVSIGTKAFVAFVPLVLLLTSKFTVHGESWLSHHFVTRYHLHGRAAAATRALFNTPFGAGTQGWLAFALSILFGLISALALTAAMQRTYEAAWGVKPLGLRGRVFGVGGVIAILLEVLLLSLIGTLVKGPAGGALHLVLRLSAATLFWLLISWLLLGRRIGWRSLLPGAITSGVGTAVVHFASGVYMPHLIAINAARYGAIGITFVIMTWLYVIGIVLVLGAVVGAQLGGARLVRRREFAER